MNIYNQDISIHKQNDIDEYIQQFYYIKDNVEEREETIHTMIYNALHMYIHIPKPYSYDSKTKQFVMKKINGMNLADMYGEKFEDVPQSIQESVRDIIRYLYYNNIEYPDITGYNFIEEYDTGKIWIVDFEHASYKMKRNEYSPFILEFIERNANTWNPEFA